MPALPWKNSWFQLAAFIGAVAGVLLMTDFNSGAQGKGRAWPSSLWLTWFSPKSPVAGRPWINSLGLVLRPIPTLDQILFAQDVVRVRDFTAFFRATGYNAEGGMYSLVPGDSGWKLQGATWENPGFSQTPNDPAVGLSWNDAQAFCQWLTAKERTEGRIGPNQFYRMPLSSEWNVAVGPARFPWGDQWPPPAGAGNLGGTEARLPIGSIPNYNDGYVRTSPVGSFAANSFGLDDMVGNCGQWAMDSTANNSGEKILRGSAWYTTSSDNLLSTAFMTASPDLRNDANGIRLVLQVSGSP